MIEEFDALLPGFTQGEGEARNQSLEVSLRFSLRRLGAEAAALCCPGWRCSSGGAIESMLLAVTEIDEATWAALKPALANAALVGWRTLPGVSVPYIHFHPTLAPFLARELTASRARRAGGAATGGGTTSSPTSSTSPTRKTPSRPAPWPPASCPTCAAACAWRSRPARWTRRWTSPTASTGSWTFRPLAGAG